MHKAADFNENQFKLSKRLFADHLHNALTTYRDEIIEKVRGMDVGDVMDCCMYEAGGELTNEEHSRRHDPHKCKADFVDEKRFNKHNATWRTQRDQLIKELNDGV